MLHGKNSWSMETAVTPPLRKLQSLHSETCLCNCFFTEKIAEVAVHGDWIGVTPLWLHSTIHEKTCFVVTTLLKKSCFMDIAITPCRKW